MMWAVAALGILLMAIAAPYLRALPLFTTIERNAKSPD